VVEDADFNPRQPSKDEPEFMTSTAESYVKHKQLGEGSFGTVHLARHRQSGLVCAIKILLRKDCVLDMDANSYREVLVHRQVCHHFCAQFYHSFRDRKHVYILLEVVLGPGVRFSARLLTLLDPSLTVRLLVAGPQQLSTASLPPPTRHGYFLHGAGGCGDRSPSQSGLRSP
jgi:serine/threonine protein kinase